MLEIKTLEGKVIATIKEIDFNQEKPLVFVLHGKQTKDTKWLRVTKKIKLILN